MGFWNKVGNVVGTALEVGTEIISALAQEGAKKQASMLKEAERQVNTHERKVTQAANSNRMYNPEYTKKIQEEKEKIERAKTRLNNEKEKIEKFL
jgi:hypothetical protein